MLGKQQLFRHLIAVLVQRTSRAREPAAYSVSGRGPRPAAGEIRDRRSSGPGAHRCTRKRLSRVFSRRPHPSRVSRTRRFMLRGERHDISGCSVVRTGFRLGPRRCRRIGRAPQRTGHQRHRPHRQSRTAARPLCHVDDHRPRRCPPREECRPFRPSSVPVLDRTPRRRRSTRMTALPQTQSCGAPPVPRPSARAVPLAGAWSGEWMRRVCAPGRPGRSPSSACDRCRATATSTV